jgi:hypothetical protein
MVISLRLILFCYIQCQVTPYKQLKHQHNTVTLTHYSLDSINNDGSTSDHRRPTTLTGCRITTPPRHYTSLTGCHVASQPPRPHHISLSGRHVTASPTIRDSRAARTRTTTTHRLPRHHSQSHWLPRQHRTVHDGRDSSRGTRARDRRVSSLAGMFFFGLFRVFLLITTVFRFYICYTRMGRVREGGGDENGPKRR